MNEEKEKGMDEDKEDEWTGKRDVKVRRDMNEEKEKGMDGDKEDGR